LHRKLRLNVARYNGGLYWEHTIVLHKSAIVDPLEAPFPRS